MSKRGTLTLTGVVGEEESPALLQAPGKRVSALDLVASRQWAMLPDALESIISIATRANDSIEAVEEKLGRPLINTQSVSMRNDIAIIPVAGPIFRYANLFTRISGGVSLDVLSTDIRSAVDNPAVRAIVLEFDSPGGDATSIAELAQRIREMSEDKPIMAHIDGLGASAAYYLASATSRIVVSSTALVGSIGVVTTVYRGKADDVVEIVSSQSPDKRLDINSDEGRQKTQELVDKFADVFINDVAKYRDVTRETVLKDFGRGGLKLGAESVEAGMADAVGTLESLITGLSGNQHSGGSAMSGNDAPEKPEITRDYLDANHPDLVKAIREEGYTAGHAEGLTEGAEGERERIQAVEGQVLPGHEKLIEQLKFDGKTTGEQAAIAVLKAEREGNAGALKDRQEDAAVAGKPIEPGTGDPPEKKDYESLVQEQIDAGKSRAGAIRHVIANHPEAHKAYLDKQTGGDQ